MGEAYAACLASSTGLTLRLIHLLGEQDRLKPRLEALKSCVKFLGRDFW